MIKAGEYSELTVLRDTSSGLFLGDEEGGEVLLPGKYIPTGAKVGDKLKVFIYNDSEARPIATTLQPAITLHKFAFLDVNEVTDKGAYLDWGLDKDLFVPFREQQEKMQKGHGYMVYLYMDGQTCRLAASSRVNRYLQTEPEDLQEGDEVEIVIWEYTDLGVNVIVDHKYKGLVYAGEVYEDIRLGDVRKGYIKKIREDHKLDITLQKPGFANVEENAEKLLKMLKQAGGFLPFTDKSSPEEIIENLHMSKKTFKKAVGILYKQRAIVLEDKGIRLM